MFAQLHALHGDLGWKSIHIGLKINMLRLWNKIVNMSNRRIPRMVFIWECNLGLNNWCSEVEQILGDINCNDIFNVIVRLNVTGKNVKPSY